jgi:hypothetical protein
LVVKDIIIDSSTFSGLQLDGSYTIFAGFENIEITNAGTDGIYLTSAISGEASFSHVTISESMKNNFLNYSPTLLFTITFGEGNIGWQFP